MAHQWDPDSVGGVVFHFCSIVLFISPCIRGFGEVDAGREVKIPATKTRLVHMYMLTVDHLRTPLLEPQQTNQLPQMVVVGQTYFVFMVV